MAAVRKPIEIVEPATVHPHAIVAYTDMELGRRARNILKDTSFGDGSVEGVGWSGTGGPFIGLVEAA